MKRWLPIIVALGMGCGPAVETDETTASTDDDPSMQDVEPGEQPSEPGSMYSACEAVAQCAELEFCVFPPGESGYCSSACNAPTDPSNCAAAPGEGAQVSCLDIGIPDGRQVCALDCSEGVCPEGMRCEGIETSEGARQICF